MLDASGQPIAGSSGQSGGTFQATFGKKGVNLTSVAAKAFDMLAAMGNGPLGADLRTPNRRRRELIDRASAW